MVLVSLSGRVWLPGDYEIKMCDPYSAKAKTLNARSVLAFRSIGRGNRSMETVFGLMDMLPPVTAASYGTHNYAVAQEGVESGKIKRKSSKIKIHTPHIHTMISVNSVFSNENIHNLLNI